MQDVSSNGRERTALHMNRSRTLVRPRKRPKTRPLFAFDYSMKVEALRIFLNSIYHDGDIDQDQTDREVRTVCLRLKFERFTS